MKMELYCLSFLDVESLEDTLWCQSVLTDGSEVKVGGKSKGTLHGTQWNCRAFLDIFALSTVTWGLLLTKLSKFCYDVMVLLLNIPVASSPCIYTNFHHYFSHHWLMEQGCRSGESSPPTNVARVRFNDLALCVGWVGWFSTLLWKVFLRVLRFSALLKNQSTVWYALIRFDFCTASPISAWVLNTLKTLIFNK